MPFLYIYQLSDFDTTPPNQLPPNEMGAQASGSPPFCFQLLPGATPILVEITDTDGNPTTFGELGNNQTLTNGVTLNDASGTPITYPAGDTIRGDYLLGGDAATPGLEVAGISIGTNNSGNNAITGLIATQPLVPGQKYEFTTEQNYNGNQRDYEDFVCFTMGTLIDTPTGPVAVENLHKGDLVLTKSSGPQPIGWIGSRTLSPQSHQRPVRFSPETIGNDAEILVSPQHRILISGWKAEVLFGETEVLVPAIALVDGDKVRQIDMDEVTYFHIMFDTHHLVKSHGAWTESLLYAENTLETLTPDQREEIESLFPELNVRDATPCHMSLTVQQAAVLR